jgi:drug/metabolite transporter (DMT)-like permease
MATMLFANTFLVAGTILFKRWAPPYHLTVLNGVQLLTASAALLVPSMLLEPVAAIRWDVSFLGALAYLTLAVSCGAMLIWFFLLQRSDASKASVFFFLNPVFGLLLGALLLGEPLHVLDFVGTAGVAAGIYLVQRAR